MKYVKLGLSMLEFLFDSSIHLAFGFHNPNHAAALLCALASFLCVWGGGGIEILRVVAVGFQKALCPPICPPPLLFATGTVAAWWI